MRVDPTPKTYIELPQTVGNIQYNTNRNNASTIVTILLINIKFYIKSKM